MFPLKPGYMVNRMNFLSWLFTRQMVIQNPMGLESKKTITNYRKFKKNPFFD